MSIFSVSQALGVRSSFGLLALRLVAGTAFMVHGWGKIQQPLSWMGDTVPGPLQALAAIAEFGGGLAWILGLLTPIASFGLLCTMLVAVYLMAVQWGKPFVDPKGGSYELALVYAVIALLLLVIGPGRFSLDRVLFRTKPSLSA